VPSGGARAHPEADLQTPSSLAGAGRLAWRSQHLDGRAHHHGLGDQVDAVRAPHTLALTNRGGASAADLIELARAVRDGVRGAYGIDLVPEPVMVGTTV